MSQPPRIRRRNRIRHRMGIAEIAMRLLLFLGCVLGIAYLGTKVRKAVENRLRQKSLVAEATSSTEKDDEFLGAVPMGEGQLRGVFSGQPSDDARSQDSQDKELAAIDSPITQPSFKDTSDRRAIAASVSEPASSREPGAAAQRPAQGGTADQPTTAAKPRASDSLPTTRDLPVSTDDLAAIFSAPNVTLTRMADGQSFEPLKDQTGGITILDFWATWCGPCLQELPIVASVVSMYAPDQVRLIAVNTEEDVERVEAFVRDRSIDVEVALDLHGEAAAAFGVEQLPTLILIDSQGIVQRIHVGFTDGLAQTLRGELDTLLSGKTLSTDASIASYLHDSGIQSPMETLELTAWKDGASKNRHTEDMLVRLSSGEEVKVGTRFSEAKAAFETLLEESLQRNDDRVTKLTYGDPEKPSLIFSRRGKQLHGPLASFYEDGASLAYVEYRFGKRVASLLSWDASGRPLVMEEYDAGVRDGLRCIFKSCGEQCETGHLWMAQEWRKGELLASHVVLNEGPITLMDHDFSGQAKGDPESYLERSLALQELDDFEKRLDSDEVKIKKSVEDYYGMLRRKLAMQVQSRLAASNVRSYAMPAAMYPGRASFSYPFQPTRAFAPRPMMIRNCGSS